MMTFYKIKNIIYSDETGNIQSECPIDMNKSHISSGWIAFETRFN